MKKAQIQEKKLIRRKIKHFAGAAVLAASLMLPGSIKAEEPTPKKPVKEEVQKKGKLSFRFTGGAYDKGDTPFIGLGLSNGFDIGPFTIDVMGDGIFSNFKSMELDHAELAITVPITERVAVSPYVYRSRYLDVDIGAGAAVHVPYDLHVAAEYCCSSADLLPVIVFWTPSFCDGKVNTLLKGVLVLTPADPESVSFGGEASVSVEVANGARIFGKVFELTVKDGNNWTVGILNFQGGLEFSP
jgi:hypothetical protein